LTLSSESFFKYDQLNESVGKFQKTPVKVFVYRKTEADSVLGYKRASSMTANQMKEILNQGVKNLVQSKMALFQKGKKYSNMSCVSDSTVESIGDSKW